MIFVEEDDAQTGVDHVDGHRSPGYVDQPLRQAAGNTDGTGAGVVEDSTFYTQVNFTRTIEQILGITPMNQNDLVASPMSEIFIDNPPRRTSCRGRTCRTGPAELRRDSDPDRTSTPGAHRSGQSSSLSGYDPCGQGSWLAGQR